MATKIVFNNANGNLTICHPVSSEPIEKIASKAVPEGIQWFAIDDADFPSDNYFGGAMVLQNRKLVIDLDKAKSMAHSHRKMLRDIEFSPHDNVIMKQIPGNDLEEAEAARQEIRERYASYQNRIDASQSTEELKSIMEEMNGKNSF